MYAQNQITRIVEETVLKCKELEARLNVVNQDLAFLCESIGHPQAAQLARTPAELTPLAQAAAVPIGSTLGVGMIPGQVPYAGQVPFAQVPWGGTPYSSIVSPYASPLGIAPFVPQFSTFAGVNPFVSPLSTLQGVSPFGNPFGTLGTPFLR